MFFNGEKAGNKRKTGERGILARYGVRSHSCEVYLPVGTGEAGVRALSAPAAPSEGARSGHSGHLSERQLGGSTCLFLCVFDFLVERICCFYNIKS